MKRPEPVLLLLLALCCTASSVADVTTIAFGSCIKPYRSQKFWGAIVESRPDALLLLGDNIYADTKNPGVMRRKYRRLAKNPHYQKLKAQVPVYAVWDDHDYGQNDAGSENPIKVEAEQQFLDFFEFPPDSPARTRPGIYHTHLLGTGEQRVQLIMLDTRYFRGPAVKHRRDKRCPRSNYGQQLDPEVSLLGAAQWRWLEQQLLQPAAARILVSSIQVIPEQHCLEKWANFPLERQRLFDLIAKTNASNVIFISGDRHLAELSRITVPSIDYPLYELTSSSLNAARDRRGEVNRYRVGADNIHVNNFGVIEIDWNRQPEIELQIRSVKGRVLLRQAVDIRQ